jgi:hypothetical protein
MKGGFVTVNDRFAPMPTVSKSTNEIVECQSLVVVRTQEAEMKRQIMRIPFAIAAASVLGACASIGADRAHSSVDLRGYTRVVSNGQDLFCDKEKPWRFVVNVCYTRAELEERQFTSNRLQGVPDPPAFVPHIPGT